MFFKSEKN